MNETPLRILIVDDEAPARNRLRELLVDCSESMSLEVIGEAANGKLALDILATQDADLVLLDIRMPDMDGIELAQHLPTLEHVPTVIFTTAYGDYAIKAFELNAIDYLLKPIRAERLLNALNKALTMVPITREALRQVEHNARKYLSVSERGKVLLVPVEDILYLKAELKYITIRTREREYLLEESLTNLEEEFAERFVRIHRNCLVARAYIEGFERHSRPDGESHWIVLIKDSDERLSVSRRQQHIVRELGRES